jgi:hypothetical protein
VLTPEERSTRARMGAYAKWANMADRHAWGINAQKGLMAKFEGEVRAKFPDASDEQVAKMVDASMKLHFTRLGYLSGKARKAKRNGPAS